MKTPTNTEVREMLSSSKDPNLAKVADLADNQLDIIREAFTHENTDRIIAAIRNR